MISHGGECAVLAAILKDYSNSETVTDRKQFASIEPDRKDRLQRLVFFPFGRGPHLRTPDRSNALLPRMVFLL